jgi:hypothetical protein
MTQPTKREIPKSKWLPFFDHVSTTLRGKAADITIASPDGEQHQSHLWQLHGITYDPHDDALIVSCRQQEHVISSPKSISVEEIGAEMAAVEVCRSAGEREIVRFESPLRISAQ